MFLDIFQVSLLERLFGNTMNNKIKFIKKINKPNKKYRFILKDKKEIYNEHIVNLNFDIKKNLFTPVSAVDFVSSYYRHLNNDQINQLQEIACKDNYQTIRFMRLPCSNKHFCFSNLLERAKQSSKKLQFNDDDFYDYDIYHYLYDALKIMSDDKRIILNISEIKDLREIILKTQYLAYELAMRGLYQDRFKIVNVKGLQEVACKDCFYAIDFVESIK